MLNYVAKMQDDSNHSYDFTRKSLKKDGVTLVELLVAISLMGFIFALGIHPMISQLRMVNAERDEIILFDDANLAVFYITKDAMEARDNNALPWPVTSNTITFTIVLSPPAWTGGILDTATASYTVNGSQLVRVYTDSTGSTTTIITNKLDPATAPVFSLITAPNPVHRHQLYCYLRFQEPTDATITTEREFQVICSRRDARREP